MSDPTTNYLVADAKYDTPLPLKESTVLITGASSGLGLALAKRFVSAGSTVIVTGRREEQLEEAKNQCPALHTIKSDAGSASDREQLFKHVTQHFPNINILVNNAGIQRRVGLAQDTASWAERATEIEVNFSAPIHLSSLFAPYLVAQKQPGAIINISSGLAYVPFVPAPTYAATKAGVHSFTMALRWSLASTPIRVIEIVPPAVKSNLGGGHDFGEDQDEWADHTFARFVEGHHEIGYKFSDNARHASREQSDQMFTNMSGQFAKTLGTKQYE